MTNNYTLGRGEIFFDRFAPGTKVLTGERYIGNTPELNLTIEEEKLEHFSSDRGVREKDDSISLQVNRTGTMTTDNVSPENLALFFFGSVSALSVSGATITAEAHNGVKQGHYYQLGRSTNNPSGARALDVHTAGPPAVNIVVKNDAGSPVTYDENDDYTIDMVLGRLYIVPGGAIVDGTNLRIDYKTKTSTRQRIISGSTAIEGALRYVARNPKGEQVDYFFPYVQLSPNGDFALKSDEFQAIPFNIEILKLDANTEAIYGDLRAVTA